MIYYAIQTGLHLQTGNTSSDQSVVDDGISPNSEDKRAKNEVIVENFDLILRFCVEYMYVI